MQNKHHPMLFVLGILGASPWLLAQDPPRGQRPIRSARVQAVESKTVDEGPYDALDAALGELESRWSERGIEKQRISALRDMLGAPVESESSASKPVRLRTRLNAAIADLEARAEKAQLGKQDLARMRERLLDVRLESALDRLQERARAGELDQKELERIQAHLQRRAEIVRQSGAAEDMAQETAMQAKVAMAIAELQQRASGAIQPQDLLPLREAIVQHRLDRSLQALEENVVEKRATDADVGLVQEILRDRGELGEPDEAQAGVLERYLHVLDGIKQRAIDGQMTREEFAQLRAQLTAKARAALSGR